MILLNIWRNDWQSVLLLLLEMSTFAGGACNEIQNTRFVYDMMIIFFDGQEQKCTTSE